MSHTAYVAILFIASLFFVLIEQLPNINHQNRKYISHGMYEVGYETTICAGPVLSYSNRASWL